MKVEVNENKTEKKIEFPCLMIHSCGLVIIATKRRGDNYSGIVLIAKKTNHNIGEFGDFNGMFKPLNGSITLSND